MTELTKRRLETMLLEIRKRAELSRGIGPVYDQMVAWSKQLELAIAELVHPPISAAATAADERIRARVSPRCLWAKAVTLPGFTEFPITMGDLVAVELPPNCTITDDTTAKGSKS